MNHVLKIDRGKFIKHLKNNLPLGMSGKYSKSSTNNSKNRQMWLHETKTLLYCKGTTQRSNKKAWELKTVLITRYHFEVDTIKYIFKKWKEQQQQKRNRKIGSIKGQVRRQKTVINRNEHINKFKFFKLSKPSGKWKIIYALRFLISPDRMCFINKINWWGSSFCVYVCLNGW